METKVVGGRDTRWKVLEGAWVVGTRGLEFRCCTECNMRSMMKHLTVEETRSQLRCVEMLGWYPLLAKNGEIPVVALGALL